MTDIVAWFEIGTDRPEAAERFYGTLFGWSFADDDSASPDGSPYRIVTTAAGGPKGGLAATGGTIPNYAIFTVLVEDTAASCRRAVEAGGQVLRGPKTEPGGLSSAYLLDPAGNQIGIFTPPPKHD
jgi:predicted enzyme related to lactoylglutathione lyase